MSKEKFSWVKTHQEITEFLKTKENSQIELIEILKTVGITPFNDKDSLGNRIELNEIDPFTFFCYIYKYGPERRLLYLQKVAQKIRASIPFDEKGIPTAQKQKVWLFPYKAQRVNNEVSRLWSFFYKALTYNINEIDFEDVLKINSVGKTKLSEGLFYIDPINYLPINGPIKPYLIEVLGINPIFNTFKDYINLLGEIKSKTDSPFYELSYKAWEWGRNNKNKMIDKSTYSDQLISFLTQAKTENLKTKHFVKEYNGTKVKVSFGQGVSARIPWISFLKKPFTTSEGIYPVYLYFKNSNKLVLAYGISETTEPPISWNLSNPTLIKDYFKENNLNNPDRYGDSYLFKIYDVDNLPSNTQLDEDLNNIISQYLAINSEVQKPLMSQIDFDIKEFTSATSNAGLTFEEELTTRYISSLATKPFVLLSGLSGSGKTKLAQSFAQWISEDKSQYCIVPVGADWTNREPLLGYVNALEPSNYILPENGALELIIRANKDQNKPYFLILDEMNLSHVERYFADFLSVMESKDKFKLHSSKENLNKAEGEKYADTIEVPSSLDWPKNLFVVGTVNIDETTYMFSPKVLDRANVIEFRVDESDMKSYLANPSDIKDLNGEGKAMGESFVEIARNNPKSDAKEIIDPLHEFFTELQKIGSEFGYRTASEIQILFSQIDIINPAYKDKSNEKIDIAIMQKLLPKLHGSRTKLTDVLNALAILCYKKDVLNEEQKKEIFKNRKEIQEKPIYPISLEKIQRMYDNLIANGFTSYAEA